MFSNSSVWTYVLVEKYENQVFGTQYALLTKGMPRIEPGDLSFTNWEVYSSHHRGS